MLLFAVCLVLSTVVAAQGEHYATKFDNVDVDEILNNHRLYAKYIECLKGGKCTPDAKELKEILPDALQTDCSKCTEKQKDSAEKVMKFIMEKKPEDFKALEEIYDPEGVYVSRYKEEAAKRGISI